MSVWANIILEGFCMFKTMSKKYWKLTPISFDGKEPKTEPVQLQLNEHYISPNKRLSWCKKYNKERIPNYKCLKDNCPFFAYSNGQKKLYNFMRKFYHE